MVNKVSALIAMFCCGAIGVACSMDFNSRGEVVGSSPEANSSSKANAEDFARDYNAKENSRVRIKNVSGDIIVRGTDGNRISVRGIKEGRNKDQVEVEDRSSNDGVDLGVKYNCRNCNASIRFEVEVPRGMRLRFDEISTASGDVEISNVNGNLEAQSASGNVKIQDVSGKVEANSASGNVVVRDISGEVNAETASGNVEVSIKQLNGDGDMKYSSASGNVEVTLPSDTNADVELSTISGSVKTDFPIEVQRPQYGPGESAEGQLGSGGRKLKLSAVSGNVKLLRL